MKTPNTKHQTPKPKLPTVPPLWKNSPKMLDVFARIAAERSRQRELYYTGKISFDCASPVPDANRKLRVLVEETGEVAEAIDCHENAETDRERRSRRDELQTELVQVAAVAVAWLESMEGRDAR